jgi:hypothetical protein
LIASFYFSFSFCSLSLAREQKVFLLFLPYFLLL